MAVVVVVRGDGRETEGGRGTGGGGEEEEVPFAGNTTCLRQRSDPSRHWRQKEKTGGGERAVQFLSMTQASRSDFISQPWM